MSDAQVEYVHLHPGSTYNAPVVGPSRRSHPVGSFQPSMLPYSVTMSAPHPDQGPGDIAPGDRTGRIGVMYLRGLLAQAGIRNEESSPGEDYGAVDLTVHLTSAPVTVQVKTSVKRRNRDGTYSVPLESAWCAKWAGQKVPVYLVFVALSKNNYCDLITQAERSTTWHAHAYWVQVNDVQPGTVRVPVQNRLHLDTFQVWDRDVERAFTRGAA